MLEPSYSEGKMYELNYADKTIDVRSCCYNLDIFWNVSLYIKCHHTHDLISFFWIFEKYFISNDLNFYLFLYVIVKSWYGHFTWRLLVNNMKTEKMSDVIKELIRNVNEGKDWTNLRILNWFKLLHITAHKNSFRSVSNQYHLKAAHFVYWY